MRRAPTSAAVWHDTRKRGRCEQCDFRVETARRLDGNQIAVDDDVVLIRSYPDPASGRVIDVVDLRNNHRGTCPAAFDGS